MSEKEVTRGSRKGKKPFRGLKVVLVVVAVLVVAVGALKGRDAVRWFKGKRAVSLVEKMRGLMEEEEWAEAYRTGNDAYTLAPDQPDVLRAMADLTSMSRQTMDKCVYLMRRLRELGEENLGDRKREVKVLTAMGDLDGAETRCEALLKEAAEDAEVYDLMASVRSARGDVTGAVGYLEKSLELNPDNLENQLKIAAARAESSFEEVRADGWNEMWEISGGQGATGMRALEYIGAKEQVPVGREQEFIERLEGHPDSTESHRLLALKWKITIDPLRRSELLAEAIEERKGQPMTELVEFLDWLNRIGEPQPLLDVLTLENAKVDAVLFSLYLNALGKLERWEDVEAALRSDGVPLSPGQVHFTRSNAMRQRGVEDDTLKDEVTKAVQYAVVEKNVQLSFQAGVLAEDLGYSDSAMDGYKFAATSAAIAVAAYERMFELARRSGDTEKMGEVFDELEEKNLSAPDLLLEGTYLNLLVGNEVELYRRRAKALVEARESDSVRWLVLALGHFRMLDLDACREACERIDPGSLGAGKRAVFAALLGGTGDKNRAHELAQSVPSSLLLDEERALMGRRIE